jgi:hypothetical protein
VRTSIRRHDTSRRTRATRKNARGWQVGLIAQIDGRITVVVRVTIDTAGPVLAAVRA